MLTFEQFKDTGEELSVSDATEVCGVDEDQFDGALSVWVFCDSLYITEWEDGEYACEVYGDQWVGTRLEMTKRLYVEFYATECLGEGDYTVEGLNSAYRVYNELNDSPDYRWLEWFAGSLSVTQEKE